MKEMNLKVKPCPFCGREVKNITSGISPYGVEVLHIKCECGAEVDFKGDGYFYENEIRRRSGKDALEKWNTRAGDEE